MDLSGLGRLGPKREEGKGGPEIVPQAFLKIHSLPAHCEQFIFFVCVMIILKLLCKKIDTGKI